MPETARDQQRAELHKTIWSIADDLRGSVDGWDFKQYVLCTLFYRFVSENLCAYLAEQEGEVPSSFLRTFRQPLGPSRAATLPAVSRPGSGGNPTRSPRRT